MIRLERRRLRRCALLVGLLVPGSTPAQAAPANTVVLVRTPNKAPGRWRAAEERTRDELRVMGIGVVEIEYPEDRPDIERALAEHAARVAVRVEREGDIGGAEIWWVEAASGDVKAARIEGLATAGGAAAAMAALHAAELVRTRIQAGGEEAGARDRSVTDGAVTVPEDRSADTAAVGRAGEPIAESGARDSRPSFAAGGEVGVHRLESAPGPPPIAAGPPDIGVPEAVEVPAIAAGPTWSAVIDPLDVVVPAPVQRARHSSALTDRAVGVYTNIGGGPGGAGPLIGGGLALRWHLLPALAMQAEAQGATSPTWRPGQGQTFRVGLAGARAALVFVARQQARVSWRLGLGGGLTLAWALARSRDRLSSSQDRVVIGTLRASVHAAIRIRARLRLVIGADVDLLAPPVAVRVKDTEMARLGTPLVRGVLGLEWDWSSRTPR